MRWDRVSIETPEYTPGGNQTLPDGTAPITLAQISDSGNPVQDADWTTAAGLGCSKHRNNDASCPYKNPSHPEIKMKWDNVSVPPPAPANGAQTLA